MTFIALADAQDPGVHAARDAGHATSLRHARESVMAIPIAHEKILNRIPDGAHVYNRRSGSWGIVLGWMEIRKRRVRCRVQPISPIHGRHPRETWWATENLSEYRIPESR